MAWATMFAYSTRLAAQRRSLSVKEDQRVHNEAADAMLTTLCGASSRRRHSGSSRVHASVATLKDSRFGFRKLLVGQVTISV